MSAVFEQFAGEARAAVRAALEEARQRGDRRLGTEHLLLGVLHARELAPLGEFGVELGRVRATLADLDREALAVVGVDVRGVERAPVPLSSKRTPLTSGARSVLRRAVGATRSGGGRRITPAHLMMAIVDAPHPDPAAEVLSKLNVDREAVRVRLRQLPV
ncbi:Clp protease N-terminal domain-containing protein [Micromonospora sp. NBC_01638]|uniref:Clp protease N-terminal domain-containing protein n=1 Tax=Micromonospora sp. NBC_01638 TaxID=2975982 RepID=UPI00386B71E2|nr:hypothetical protein OG811_26505 [Micromonospora sp. NBC_01638]